MRICLTQRIRRANVKDLTVDLSDLAAAREKATEAAADAGALCYHLKLTGQKVYVIDAADFDRLLGRG